MDCRAAFSVALCAANGVLFLAPLNPQPPAEAQETTPPFVSVIVTIVLLKVAWIWTTPLMTFFFTFLVLIFFLLTSHSIK